MLQVLIETVLQNLNFREKGKVTALQNQNELERFFENNTYFAGIEFDDTLNVSSCTVELSSHFVLIIHYYV